MRTLMAASWAILALGLWAATADAAEIRLVSAGAVKAIVTELAESFRQETGHTVVATFAPVGEVRQRIAAGEPADVVILTDVALEALAASGVVPAAARRDIAKVGIGVGVREGAAVPDISTVDAFRQALLAAKSIVYVDPARGATSGIHFAGVLQRLGIADAVKDKTLLWPGGASAEAVADGRAELCVQQMSEILPVKGVKLVGPLPREIQKSTVYSAAPLARSTASETARAFIAYLARPAFKAKFAAAGLDYHE